MDLDIIQSTKEGEITQFLCDVRDYFRASLATSEYENTSNMFFVTESDSTEMLLQRCEQLLNRLTNNQCQNQQQSQQQQQHNLITYTIPKPVTATTATTVTNGLQNQWQSGKDNIKLQQQQQQQLQHQQHHQSHQKHSVTTNGSAAAATSQPDLQQSAPTHLYQQQQDEVSYLDMSAANNKTKSSPSSRESSADLNSSADSDKTFRCSTMIVKQKNKSFLHRLHDTMTTTTDEEAENDSIDGQLDDEFEDDPQIYDICQVTTQGSDGEEDHLEETQKAITPESHFSLPHMECPYMDLPAGHLAIHKSTKYGQLQRIEKRLFFDQSKKCYCGILNDWLLCYADGPTSNKPTITLYLKMPGIEIEHFGEGKRRDVCFQVSTSDPTKRFVFQAINEIDAKEWIHAIEAAIRSDIGTVIGSNSVTVTRSASCRKLPTPPVMKKMTFLSTFQKAAEVKQHSSTNAMSTSQTASDCIYEEPSPVYNVHQKQVNGTGVPDLPQKQNSPSALAERFEYDVPKCPPQPLKGQCNDETQLINPYDNEVETVVTTPQKSPTSPVGNFITPPKINLKMEEKLNFQAKVKDVHSKLSSQLSNGGPVALKKPLKKTYSSGSSQMNDGESLIMSTSPPAGNSSPVAAELKKQKKSTTPQNSPQKTEKTSATKNWFLNRLNKTTSSTRSNSSTNSTNSSAPSKCKQSEKENLLNSSDTTDGYDNSDSNLSSNPASPILKSAASPTSIAASAPNGKGKVNMLINQLEASGHLASMFSVDAVASFSSFCDNDCNNYEPIMTVSSPPSSFLKKV
ncbi:PH domain-containing protein blown fuse [Musca autumnalis]|uniref:PH domain-containing protein blown fuse n=1 Tax=Musca autumnalis TaxID=221902 RepID=UPI003CF858BA